MLQALKLLGFVSSSLCVAASSFESRDGVSLALQGIDVECFETSSILVLLKAFACNLSVAL